jgi:class 3 adenylate cyclase/tetratricopeptide (TPR) repeat protein
MTFELTEGGTVKQTRQHLTLLFSDLSGSTRLCRALEPEEYAAIMDRIREVWRLAAERHGGHVVRMQGDGAVIMFGFPQLTEDEGRRAVEAALDIHQQVSQITAEGIPPELLPLAMHSGVHAGTVLVTPGDMERGRFDLTGDVPNTAAHLADLASRGEIAVSSKVLGPYANCFESHEIPAEKRIENLHVRLVLGRSGIRRRFDATAQRGLTPFMGRAELSAQVAEFLAEPGQIVRPRCLVVVGPAGIGKTRLLEEVVMQRVASGTALMHGGCEVDFGAEVLQPFGQMIRSYFGVPGRVRLADLDDALLANLQSWREQLGPASDALLQLLTSDPPPSSRRLTTGGIVGDLMAFFSALATRSDVLMLIDDWQWADDASLQLLNALLDGASSPRVILASRPRDTGRPEIQGARHLSLMPLALEDTRQAIRHWMPYADPFLCRQIHEYSGGIPLLIEELCHSASVGALARAIEERGITQNWVAWLPVTRLGRLPAGLADLVRVAAVIGNEVPLWLLELIHGRVPDPAALKALSDADFLYASDAAGSLRFKHGLTRDVIYQSILLPERTQLHRQVLAVLMPLAEGARDDVIEALVHHSRGAGHWEQASAFAERAGDKATNAFALDRARIHYELAMAALDRMAPLTPDQTLRWCLLSNKLGMTCIFDPLALANDPATFERAVALARQVGDPGVLARATYWLAYICYGLGRFRESLRHAREALALARDSADGRLTVQIEATLGQVLAATCEYAEAIEWIDVAVDAKRQRSRPRGGLAIGSAYALACKGGILADRGEFTDAHACFDEAIDLLDGSTHPVANSVRNWIAVAHNWQGNWADAKRIASDSVRIAENTRALLLLSAARSSSGYADWAHTRSAAGLKELNEAMRWMDERQGHFYTSIYYGWLVAACVAEDRRQEARAHAFKVLQRARKGEHLGEAVACRTLAWTASTSGDGAAGQRWMARAEKAADRRLSPREHALNQWTRGQIALRLGQPDMARSWLDQAAASLDKLSMSWHARQALQHAASGEVSLPVFT